MSKIAVFLTGALFLALCLVPIASAESSDTATEFNATTSSIVINKEGDQSGNGWNWSQKNMSLTISENLNVTGYILISYDGLEKQDIVVNVRGNLAINNILGSSDAFYTNAKSVAFTGGSIGVVTLAPCNGINAEGNLLFKDLKSISVEITGSGTFKKSCIHSYKSIEFDNVDEVSLNTPFYGITFQKNVTIENCKDFNISLMPSADQVAPSDAAGIVAVEDDCYSIKINNSKVTVTCSVAGFIAFECGYLVDSKLDMGEPKGNVVFYDQNLNIVKDWDSKNVKSVVFDRDNGKVVVDSSGPDNTKLIVGIVCAVIIVILLLSGGYYYFRDKI